MNACMDVIQREESRYYVLTDKEVAVELFEAAKTIYPDAMFFEDEKKQYICLTKEAVKDLKRFLKTQVSNKESELRYAIFLSNEFEKKCKKRNKGGSLFLGAR